MQVALELSKDEPLATPANATSLTPFTWLATLAIEVLSLAVAAWQASQVYPLPVIPSLLTCLRWAFVLRVLLAPTTPSWQAKHSVDVPIMVLAPLPHVTGFAVAAAAPRGAPLLWQYVVHVPKPALSYCGTTPPMAASIPVLALNTC